ncbi:hypothetical protein NDU88_005261 [Pleurodeles waltl]|uniref:Uncharacterized protein n=1 Tax=Pleurodeles waltl TaxID=8319 RepID=A0AAV7PFF1_PLEWA|nr:hypothetical protein NDU88_005261 [Pleurodeles waltl]
MACPGTSQDVDGVSPKREPDTCVVSPPQASSAPSCAGSGSGSRIALHFSQSQQRAALCDQHGSRPGRTQGDACHSATLPDLSQGVRDTGIFRIFLVGREQSSQLSVLSRRHLGHASNVCSQIIRKW